MPSNHNKSNFKITETAPFPPHRLSDISIAIHSNSIAGSVHNRFAVKQTYCEHDYVHRYWIWMNSYWSVRKSARWKGSRFCDFEIGLVVIWRHLSHFWHIRFLCFLTWVMRRTVANINPKIIHFDAVDFSGHHSKKLLVSFDAQCIYTNVIIIQFVFFPIFSPFEFSEKNLQKRVHISIWKDKDS